MKKTMKKTTDFKMSPAEYERRVVKNKEDIWHPDLKQPGFGMYMAGMAVFGVVVMALFGIGACSFGNTEGIWFVILSPFEGGLAGATLGLILSPICLPIARAINRKRLAKKREKIVAYEKEFERAASKKSADYVESDIVTTVAYLVKSSFLKKIKLANRDSSIKDVVAEYSFSIYKDKITSYELFASKPIELCSFEKSRIENIENVFEMCAIATAIEKKAIQSTREELKEETYDKNFKLSTYFIYSAYGEDCVTATIKYTAPNVNFVPLKKL